ncbi:MAG: hypothetical protein LKM36_01080 [Flavobacteriales bacterium]|jgi:hypothetical protein|nr:hypothetical protein [Flavobacteriales bacterium]
MKANPMNYAALALALTIGSAAQAQRGYTRAQDRMLEEARSFAYGEQWADAYMLYKGLLPIDTTFADVYQEAAMCELRLPGMRDLADGHFEIAARLGNTEAVYHMALARHRQQRFDEEIALLEQYGKMRDRDTDPADVDRQMQIAKYAKLMTARPVDLRIRNLGTNINSPAHDYCPIITAEGNTMYFTSRRKGTMGSLKDASGQEFEDIYTATSTNGEWATAANVGAPLNTEAQDATVGLGKDGNEMIIYRADATMLDGDLFIASKLQGRWQEPVRMTDAINSDAHEPSATISPDGAEIYFSSDRAGGFGGRDLYRIRRLPNGEWSLPLNLGPKINTQFDEDAPFMHSDGTTLFFSSNGHNTMGGFDIFKASLTDPDLNTWATPENMGYPLNTVNDDIYFCLSADGRTGYFSSERPNGLGGQDIYQAIFPVNQIEYQLVRGVVVNGNDVPLKASIVLSRLGNDEPEGTYLTNGRTGRYLMAVRPGADYHVQVTAPGYDALEQDLHADDNFQDHIMSLDFTLVSSERTAGATPKK